MPIISIIVPVYNVEKYLEKCVNSIINQSFNDIEIILVDDGSTDSSGKICDEYAIKDFRIKVIHKKNGGLSDARNVGIENAHGAYLGFVDSDDYIAEDMYQVLYHNLIENQADISICGLYDCYGTRLTPQCNSKEFLILDSKQALKTVLIGDKFSVNAINKLYKKTLFDKIKYPVGKLSEDAFVTPKLLAKTEKVVATTEPKYYYIHRKNSITTSQFKLNDLNVIEAYKINLSFVKQHFPDLKKQAMFRYIWAHMYALDKMLLSENLNFPNEYKKIVSFLKRNTLKILLDENFTTKRKLATIIFLFSTSLYRRLTVKNHENMMALFD